MPNRDRAHDRTIVEELRHSISEMRIKYICDPLPRVTIFLELQLTQHMARKQKSRSKTLMWSCERQKDGCDRWYVAEREGMFSFDTMP